jgi:CHAT domain-containing protein
MADPDYNARGRSSTPRNAGVRGEPQRRSADLDGSAPWKPLPATAEEASQLAPLLQVQRPITGAEATAARALQQKAPRIFHIATHGFFEADQPEPPERPGGIGEGRAAARSAGSPRREDEATAAFMVEYYQRLRAGEGRMAALANTHAAFRKHANPLYRDLYVWGAFQLTGDWRPIKRI